MKKIKLIILTISIFQIGLAQTSSENITEKFFKDFAKDPVKAYENLFIGNKWMKDKSSQIETAKIKLKDDLTDMGNYYGYELITEKKAGPSLLLKCFLVRYERQPIRFTFILYKPDSTWQLQNFSYDGEINDELKESAKAYRLEYNW